MNERADLGVDQVTLSLVLSGRLNRALDSGRIGPPRDRPLIKSLAMSTIRTKDGTQLHYNDWGAGQRVVASHGWPLSADAFEDQMFFFGLARLPVHRTRPTRPRPLEPAVER